MICGRGFLFVIRSYVIKIFHRGFSRLQKYINFKYTLTQCYPCVETGRAPSLRTDNRGKFEWGLYGLYKRLQNNAKEFLSGYMREVMHFFPWVERMVREEYRRDSNGNQYKVKVEHFIHHPDEYVKVFNIDLQKHISKWEFESICDLWGTPFHSFQTHYPNCVQGGGGEACEWDGDEMSTETATITHRYSNPLRQSNSIFRSRIISKKKAKELGLCNYPKASRDNDQQTLSPGYAPT